MRPKGICIKCGSIKPLPESKCNNCVSKDKKIQKLSV